MDSNGTIVLWNVIQTAFRKHDSFARPFIPRGWIWTQSIRGEHQTKSLEGWFRLHGVLAKGVGTSSSRRWQSYSSTAPWTLPLAASARKWPHNTASISYTPTARNRVGAQVDTIRSATALLLWRRFHWYRHVLASRRNVVLPLSRYSLFYRQDRGPLSPQNVRTCTSICKASYPKHTRINLSTLFLYYDYYLPPLCRVFTITYPKQTMFLEYSVATIL